jgi:chromate transporter
VAGLIRGVKPIVIVLLVGLIIDLIPGTFPKNRYILPLVFFIVGLVAIKGFKLSPVLVIIASMVSGMIFLR